MSDDLLIRPAAEADLIAITAIYGDSVSNGTASYELDPPSLEEMTRRWRALTERGFPYFAAERNDTILGYAYAGPYRERRAYRFTVENAVYVAAGTRRGGIGRALMERLIETCERMGFRQMIAVIGDGTNHAASVGLHAALGFRMAGVIEGTGYKFDRWLDTAVMQRALGEGASGKPREISP